MQESDKSPKEYAISRTVSIRHNNLQLDISELAHLLHNIVDLPSKLAGWANADRLGIVLGRVDLIQHGKGKHGGLA